MTKYGNDKYWCFLDDNVTEKEIAIWCGERGDPYILARAIDKYEAKLLVDALLALSNTTVGEGLPKKALIFLDFIKSNCPEPYATMANNAIMWRDNDAYKKLLSEFPVIYS